MLEKAKATGTVSDSENPVDVTMLNQQEILMSCLAMALDCEGSIGFNVSFDKGKGKGNGRPQILPLISVSNTSWQLIEKCCKCCDAVGVKYNITPYQSSAKRRKPVWILSLVGAKRVGALLPLLMHHLTEKLYCAENVMAFIRSRHGKNGLPNAQRIYTDHELHLVQGTRRNSPETTRATPIEKVREALG